MKTFLIAASAAAVVTPVALPTVANAQSRQVRQEQRECNRELRRADNRREYNRELRECRREVNKAQRQTARDWRRYRNYDYNRYEPGYNRYYADRYYRDGRYYADRRITRTDRLYRGQNGQYYCRRNDGTTGLIIGAGVGALLGNQLNLGGSATVRTIIGGAGGALLGRAIERGSVRCN